MVSRAVADYRWQGAAMLRATTSTGPADLPRTLDLDNVAVTRGWLNRVWECAGFRNALELATPVLSDAIEAVVQGRQSEPRHVRRTAVSTVSYLLRWQHRPTPLGLFAGTAPVTVGPKASARWRDKHRVLIRPDSEWVTDMVLRLQRIPALLARLPLVANNAAHTRGDRLVAPGPPSDGHAVLLAPVEVSVRNARPVAAAMDAARAPIPYGALHGHLRDSFPQATLETDRRTSHQPGRAAVPHHQPVGAHDHGGRPPAPVPRTGTTRRGQHPRRAGPGPRAVRAMRRGIRPPADALRRQRERHRRADARPHHRHADTVAH